MHKRTAMRRHTPSDSAADSGVAVHCYERGGIVLVAADSEVASQQQTVMI